MFLPQLTMRPLERQLWQLFHLRRLSRLTVRRLWTLQLPPRPPRPRQGGQVCLSTASFGTIQICT